MKLPKPRFSFAQKRVRVPWETTVRASKGRDEKKRKARSGSTLFSATRNKRRVLSTSARLGLLFRVCKHPCIVLSHLSFFWTKKKPHTHPAVNLSVSTSVYKSKSLLHNNSIKHQQPSNFLETQRTVNSSVHPVAFLDCSNQTHQGGKSVSE